MLCQGGGLSWVHQGGVIAPLTLIPALPLPPLTLQALCGVGGPLPQALLPVRPRGRQPDLPGASVPHRQRPKCDASHLCSGEQHQQGMRRGEEGVPEQGKRDEGLCRWGALL